VHAQVRLKPEGVDGWDYGLDCVQRRACFGALVPHRATALGDYGVHGVDAVGRALDFGEEDRLHEAGCGC
jgi:hypothetical protein